MRSLWVFTAMCTAAIAVGAVFFGVASSPADSREFAPLTALPAAERSAPSVALGDSEPAVLKAKAAEKRVAPEPETAAAAAPAKGSPSRSSASSARSGGSELSRARSILAGYIAKYPILRGTTVTFGNAQGHQAIAYYQTGQIVISPNHTASLERILAHEIWHVIDYRDNGRIDWGENVPPR